MSRCGGKCDCEEDVLAPPGAIKSLSSVSIVVAVVTERLDVTVRSPMDGCPFMGSGRFSGDVAVVLGNAVVLVVDGVNTEVPLLLESWMVVSLDCLMLSLWSSSGFFSRAFYDERSCAGQSSLVLMVVVDRSQSVSQSRS